VSELLDRALAAHGGLERWLGAEEVRIKLRSGGRMFDARFQGGTIKRATGRGGTVRFSTSTPGAIFEGFPRPGQRGYFEPECVRIESEDGAERRVRAHPREAFSGLRHKLWWDPLDALYFMGYALWNYVSTPFMLVMPGFEVREGKPWREDKETWQRLEVIFPSGFPTHSPRQTFYFDERGLLRRLDYSPDVFGRWAKAANYCHDYREMSGVMVPTRRKVTLRTPGGRALPGPTMVWIEIEEFELLGRGGN
jgi:hypothetical protein